MSINYSQYNLLPQRRDKQVASGNSTSSGGFFMGGGGGGGTATELAALTDVAVSLMADQDILTWDEHLGKWVNNPGLANIITWNTNQDTSIRLLDSLKVNRAGDTMTGNLRLVKNARLQTDFIDSSTSFVSGFAGSGYQMNNNTGKFELTVDRLTVRQMMKVYELQINKISAVNGGLIISSASGKVLTSTATKLYFDENGTKNQIQFAVNDLVRSQKYESGNLDFYQAIVTGVTHSPTLGSAYIDVSILTGTCWEGADLVQVGNTTNVDRQNIIPLSARNL